MCAGLYEGHVVQRTGNVMSTFYTFSCKGYVLLYILLSKEKEKQKKDNIISFVREGGLTSVKKLYPILSNFLGDTAIPWATASISKHHPDKSPS